MICSYFIPGGISGSECWQGTGNPGSAWMEFDALGKRIQQSFWWSHEAGLERQNWRLKEPEIHRQFSPQDSC